MPTTTKYAFRYPAGADNANVPLDMQELAEDIEGVLDGFPVADLEHQTAGRLLIANGSGVITGVAMSGDVTITSGGVTAIGASKVVTGMLADEAVTNAKVADATLQTAKYANNSVSADKYDIAYMTATSSADLSLDATWRDLAGLTLTPAAGTWLILVKLNLEVISDNDQSPSIGESMIHAALNVDGSRQSDEMLRASGFSPKQSGITQNLYAEARGTESDHWIVTVDGNDVVKMQAQLEDLVGSGQAVHLGAGGKSKMRAIRLT